MTIASSPGLITACIVAKMPCVAPTVVASAQNEQATHASRLCAVRLLYDSCVDYGFLVCLVLVWACMVCGACEKTYLSQ